MIFRYHHQPYRERLSSDHAAQLLRGTATIGLPVLISQGQ
jgi:hypothetical protein